MKTMVFSLVWLLFLVAFYGGCNSSEETHNASLGQMRVLITDDPFAYSYVNSAKVTISKVEARTESGGEAVIFERAAVIDLVQLRNGLTTLLADVSLPPGRYDQLRVIIDEALIELTDGRQFPLKVPSGATSGLKIFLSPPVTVTEGQATDVLLDFDLSQSFVAQGGGNKVEDVNGFIFKPVIRAIGLSSSGGLGGIVSSDNATVGQFADDFRLANALVTISQSDVVVATAVTDAVGNYKMIGLAPGSYDLVVTAFGYQAQTIAGVEVAAGQDAARDVLLAMIPPVDPDAP